MSPTLLAVPNRPYRASSRAALTSPSLPLGPSNPPTSRLPPLPHEQPSRTLASQRSIDVPRHDLPPRSQNLTVQTSLAQADHLNLATSPQLPQLLSSKPTPNRGVYNKLKTVKSFFRRQATESDDDNDSFDHGRGADRSTTSEPGSRPSLCGRPRFLQPSPPANPDSARAAPSNVPSDSFAPPRASSSKSRPLGVRNDPIKQSHRDTHYLEFDTRTPRLPHTPLSSSTCSSREDMSPPRGNRAPSRAQKPFELAKPTFHQGSKQVTPRPSFSVPRVTTVSEAYARQAALKVSNAEQSKHTPHESRGDGGRQSPSTYSLASSANQDETTDVSLACDEDTSTDIDRQKHRQSIDDLTTESFQINVAQELKPTAACKFVLREQANSALTVSTGASSAGSSLRSSSPSGFTTCGSIRDEHMSPCSSLPSPGLSQEEEYINIRQIRQVLKGLQSLLAEYDPEATDIPDPFNGIPYDKQPPNHNPSIRINHAEFLQMIKSELNR